MRDDYLSPRLLDRAVDDMLCDFDDGTLDPDLTDALVEDALNWNDARLIAASVFDVGIKSKDDPPAYTAMVRERFVNAMMHPQYRQAIRRAVEEQGRVLGWSRASCRALATHFISRWEHRNDPPAETAAPMRNLADVLSESEVSTNEGELK